MFKIPLKKADSGVDFGPQLRNHIQTSYSEDPEIYLDDLRSLKSLRAEALSTEVHVNQLTTLRRYWGQLVYLGSKFPIDEAQIKISFAWYNSYGKSSQKPKFEKGCILFNLAALYTQLAALEDMQTDEGLKRACSYFQYASGVTGFLKNEMALHPKITASPDLSPSNLSSLHLLMLAQAQECFWRKAALGTNREGDCEKLSPDPPPPSVDKKLSNEKLAKISEKCAELYQSALTENSRAIEPFPQDADLAIKLKISLYHAQAQWKLAECELAKTPSCYGAEIARLQNADNIIKKSLDSKTEKNVDPALVSEFKAFQQSISKNLERALKDNRLIYNDRIPNANELDKIVGSQVAEPAKMEDYFASLVKAGIVGTAFFSKLVPHTVHISISLYSSKKDATIKAIRSKIDENIALVHAKLCEYNLPSSIEALEHPIGIPLHIIKYSQEVRKAGGDVILSQTWTRIQDKASQARTLLNNAISLMDEEEVNDDSLRSQYGSRWDRTSSKELTTSLRTSGGNYLDKLDRAITSDKLVEERLKISIPSIMQLNCEQTVLESVIPKSLNSSNLTAKDTNVIKIRELLGKLNAGIKQGRDMIENMKRLSIDDDIAVVLLEKVSKMDVASSTEIKPEAFNDLFKSRLDERFMRFQTEAIELAKNQLKLIGDLDAPNKAFITARQTDDSMQQRQRAIMNLETGYRSFIEISQNMNEGQKFYTDFLALLTRFEQAVKDFVFARNVDKKDRMNDLVRNAANFHQ